MNRGLEQFFTSESVSRVLASSLVGVQPRLAVDVGAGAGALLKALRSRWDDIHLLGVDIDRTLGHEPLDRCVRMYGDGLDHALPAFLKRAYGHIDLAVSNPPYTAIARSRGTDIILAEAGLLDSVGRSKKYPAELIFLAQNLRILEHEGTLAIIVPSGIVNGDRWRELRRILCSQNSLKVVIELPDNAFAQTEAKTFVMVMQKGGQTTRVSLRRALSDGSLSESRRISVIDAVVRMDWSYYEWHENQKEHSFCLRELNAEIFRGKLSAAAARKQGVAVFHTADMKHWSSNVWFDECAEPESYGKVRKGDILVARVGSRCLGRLAFVKEGQALITDCIYAIRVPSEVRQHVWCALLSANSRTNLRTLSRGVCAKYITKDQLLDVPLLK